MEERTDAPASSTAAGADHSITISTVQVPTGNPVQASCLCGWQSPVVPSRPHAAAAGEQHLTSAVEVRALASWQVEACPSWCDCRHSDQDPLEDRDHTGQLAAIRMRLADPVDFGGHDQHDWRPPRWMVYLRQPEGGGRVSVHMYCDDMHPMIVVDLRLDEAAQLASALLEATGNAR